MILSPRKTFVSVALSTSFIVGGSAVAAATTTTNTPVSLAAIANVEGIVRNGTVVSHGGLDTYGSAYSSSLLGTTVTWSEVTFTVGSPDEFDGVTSKTITLPAGKYSTLHLLAAGVDGEQPDQNFVVAYEDGSTSTVTQSISDWHLPSNYAGESRVATYLYKVTAAGALVNSKFYLYGYSLPIDGTKTISSVSLPDNRHVVVMAINLASASATTTTVTTSSQSASGGNCGMQLGTSAIFCDTFDAPAGIGNRAGDLNGNVWGVSRDLGAVNIGQGQYNAAPATELVTCSGTTTVRPPNDVIICNGQVHEATNDNASGIFDDGTVTTLAMYPKQPFDFAGRTGTVSFDVSNDSQGNHAAWPEFWVSNLPVPAPFNHFDSWESLPQDGFGVRFAAQVGPGQWGLCPNGNNLTKNRWTVDSAVVARNYVMEDVNYQGVDFGTASNPALKLNILDCVIAPADGSGVMNHIEVRVNQSEIDVYATDAGVAASPSTLRKIASLTNANLQFTRGLIWLEDVHYNADKETLMLGTSPSTSQRQHTFVWDNVAFDGPFPGRDFTFDALDANQSGPAYGAWNLGKFSNANATASWNVLNVPANPQAAAARVLFQFSEEENPAPTVLNVTVNGHAHPTAWPYPDRLTNTWRTYAVTIPITDLIAGTNVVQLGADQPLITSNVDIVLGSVPGAVPVLPGNSSVYPTSSSQ